MSTLTHDQKWQVVRETLEKNGLDLSMVKPIKQAQIIAQAESDEIIGEEPRGEGWRGFAEYLAEQHPQWAREDFWRHKNAEKLIEGWETAGFDHWETSDPALELAQGKYAVIAWWDKQTSVYPAGDTIKDVLSQIYALEYDNESPEWVESYVDLDTNESYSVMNRMARVITLTMDGEEYTAG